MGTGAGQQLQQRLAVPPLGRCCDHSMNLTAQKAGGLSPLFSCLLSSFLLISRAPALNNAQIYLGLSLFTTHPAASVLDIPCSCCSFCNPPPGEVMFL